MAAVTSVVSGSVAAAPVSATRLSSSAALATAPAQFAPVRNVNLTGSRVVAVNATYSEVWVDEPQVLASNFFKPLKLLDVFEYYVKLMLCKLMCFRRTRA